MEALGRPSVAGLAQRPPAAAPHPARRLAHLSLRRRHGGAFTCRPPTLAPPPPGAASGSGWMDLPESTPMPDAVEVFPRLRERDVYRRLGVSRDASFEEVQDARNFLVEQYKAHAESREAIELAFDAILQEKMKVRHRFGFRPPRRGARGEAQGDAPRLTLLQAVRARLEPSVPAATIVNDGSVFAALGLWAGWQSASSDPTLPLGAALCFCAWRLYEKRARRDPDGPHWGGSPVWGALLTTLAGLTAGALASYAAVRTLPLPAAVPGEGAGLFLIVLSLGATALFLK